MQDMEQYFPVVPHACIFFTCTFQSLDEIILCDYSNENSLVVLSCAPACYSILQNEIVGKT